MKSLVFVLGRCGAFTVRTFNSILTSKQGESKSRRRRNKPPDFQEAGLAAVDYQHDRHNVHLIVYPLIFCPKRRRRVLVGPVQKRLAHTIHEVIDEQEWHL